MPENKQPEWLADATFYEIYPQSFQDTNADGIGDIPGIIKRLDYIKELGCNANLVKSLLFIAIWRCRI